jgi:hypothetical protein
MMGRLLTLLSNKLCDRWNLAWCLLLLLQQVYHVQIHDS